MKTNENSIWSANELGSRWRAALSSQSALAGRSTIGSGKSLAIGRQHSVSRPRQRVLHPSVLPVELKWDFTFFFPCLSKPRKHTRMLSLSARIADTCATTWLHCSAIEIFVTQSFLSSFALASSSLSNCRMRSGTSSLHSNSLLRTRPIAHNAACHWICCSFFSAMSDNRHRGCSVPWAALRVHGRHFQRAGPLVVREHQRVNEQRNRYLPATSPIQPISR